MPYIKQMKDKKKSLNCNCNSSYRPWHLIDKWLTMIKLDTSIIVLKCAWITNTQPKPMSDQIEPNRGSRCEGRLIMSDVQVLFVLVSSSINNSKIRFRKALVFAKHRVFFRFASHSNLQNKFRRTKLYLGVSLSASSKLQQQNI